MSNHHFLIPMMPKLATFGGRWKSHIPITSWICSLFYLHSRIPHCFLLRTVSLLGPVNPPLCCQKCLFLKIWIGSKPHLIPLSSRKCPQSLLDRMHSELALGNVLPLSLMLSFLQAQWTDPSHFLYIPCPWAFVLAIPSAWTVCSSCTFTKAAGLLQILQAIAQRSESIFSGASDRKQCSTIAPEHFHFHSVPGTWDTFIFKEDVHYIFK